MKKLVTLILLCLVIGGSSLAQGKLNKDTSEFLARLISSKSPHYLIKLNDQIIPYSAFPMLALVGQQQIDAMEIYSGKKADSLYAGSGEKGLIIIKIKKDPPMYTKSSFLKKYNIKKKYEKLPIYIDSTIAYHTDQFMLSISNIKSVTVAKDAESGEKYISIITNTIKFNPDPNSTYIRGLAPIKS